ncbi:hypothetical protein [Cohnella nanjingensis]|uniref:Uncharacterized protein n=1 Tax=Cohnella nanjingensis TaxID=1387779 RepID=A0A7X0RS08_9BACL|nr:hypothetical protein [Cohnella nanjingensis]MBB6672603.1 hypothetical protein [Cohnella nanjingensis]
MTDTPEPGTIRYLLSQLDAKDAEIERLQDRVDDIFADREQQLNAYVRLRADNKAMRECLNSVRDYSQDQESRRAARVCLSTLQEPAND